MKDSIVYAKSPEFKKNKNNISLKGYRTVNHSKNILKSAKQRNDPQKYNKSLCRVFTLNE